MTGGARSPSPLGIAVGSAFAVLAGLSALGLSRCHRDAVPIPSHTPSTSRSAPGATDSVSPAPAPPDEASLVVRCDLPTRPINPLIYGIGARPMHHEPQAWMLGATARRWGGNHTTRYNWEHGNAWNTGKDWFFKNVDYDGALGPAHLRFIDENAKHRVATALTVPIIGWAAKDTVSYGFPVSVHGAQQSSESGHADVGNGVDARNRPLASGPPERTSVPMSPASLGRWVRSIRQRDAARGSRSVQMYILDNEPMLWHETHRDVHPEPVSYKELLARTIAYATEIRRADPDAVIAGPALWGWLAYFGSAVDHVAQPAHPDRDAHGGVPLLPWWLGKLAAHERRTGTRLIDVVDVHFYPQGDDLGIGAEGRTDAATAALRLRSTQSLWDPEYEDESWIAEKMRVIPRIQAWIAEQYPGRGLSIGEWNFGAENHMSGGLAVAEALGRFGELGVTSAFYWDYPEADSPAFWAFRAFRNFDRKGGRFLDNSVPARSHDARVSLFASRDATGKRLVIVLLARDPKTALEATLDLSTCGAILGEKRFVYTGGARGLTPSTADRAAPNPRSVDLPPYSITVLDLRVAPNSERDR
jgi:hypothetical protein